MELMEPRCSRRINPESLKQDHKGCFKKSCHSVAHLRHYRSFLPDLTTKKISAKVFKKLLEKRIINQEAKFICNECVRSVCDFDEAVDTSGDEDSDSVEEISVPKL